MCKKLIAAITWVLVWSVRGYQCLVSPLLPPSCRFVPTCAAYTIQALEQRGIFLGIYLSLKRLLRCHPFQSGGYDPLEKPHKIAEK